MFKASTSIVILLLLTLNTYSQDTLTYAMTQDLEYAKKIKNGTAYKVYVSKDGSILKPGDTLKIEEAQGGTSTTGGRASSKTVKDFQYIYFGHFTFGKALLSMPQPLSA